MHSIRKQTLSCLLLTTLLSLTTTASPVPYQDSNSSPGGPIDNDSCTVIRTTTVISTPTATSSVVAEVPTTVAKLPSTGGATNLPGTTNPVAFVAIGRGIQNYSCTAVGATPVSIGAIAVLFDYTSIANSNETELDTFPGTAVNVPFDPFSPTPVSIAGLPAATVLGHHYFAADGTPTFNLTGAPAVGGENMILFGNKTATVTAPAGSPLGPDGTGSVAWLQLLAKVNIPLEESVGIVEAYRVETAGGNPETICSEVGTQVIPYASEYWFFS